MPKNIDKNIDPELLPFVSVFPKLDTSKDGLDDTRAMIRSFTPKPLSPAPEEIFIPSMFTDDHQVRALIYAPKGKPKAPVMVQFHGGGFVMGDAEDSHFHNNNLCTELGIYIIAVDYRLAPEHPYPCAIEDGESVVEWIVKNSGPYNFDRNKITISGESAGGGIAASLAQALGQKAEVNISSLHLIYPMLDPQTAQNQNDNKPHYIWSEDNNRQAWADYGRNMPSDLREHLPISQATPAKFPPTVIHVGTEDLFYAENLAFASKLKAASIETDIHTYQGAVHGFPMAIGTKVSDEFWDRYISAIASSIAD